MQLLTVNTHHQPISKIIMKNYFTLKKITLCLVTFIGISGAAHAVGTITGITSSPVNPVPGEQAKFKITSTGAGQCGMRLVYEVISGGGSEPSDNMLINTQPGSGGQMEKTIGKAGTYKLKAIGSPSLNPKCGGSAELIVYVNGKAAPAPVPVPAAATGKPGTAGAQAAATMPTGPAAMAGIVMMTDETICPVPYVKNTQGMDVAKGESQCIKTDATCADGYTNSRNQQTGQLTCTPKVIPDAPSGWKHGTGNGSVVYDSIPQPLVKCPKATQDWKWGTSYFKESWNRMGCLANQKIAS